MPSKMHQQDGSAGSFHLDHHIASGGDDESLCFTHEDVHRVNPYLSEYFLQQLSLRKSESARGRRLSIRVGNTAFPSPEEGNDNFHWTAYVAPQPIDDDAGVDGCIRSVRFQLHPTFHHPTHTCLAPPYEVSRIGWGTFPITITITDCCGTVHNLTHPLRFSRCKDGETTHELTIGGGDGAAPIAHMHGSSPGGGSGARPMNVVERDVEEVHMHGHMGVGRGWAPPVLETFCDAVARPEYHSMMAHEYAETPDTLRAKVSLMADLLRRSKHCVAYTGAGISTASGIDDYASKSKQSSATGAKAVGRHRSPSGLDAQPTWAHHTMAALHRAGHLAHWVQQNHDGLPQKAGYPQHALNEIHGAWFDPSNPVVPMSGSLRDDLYDWMEREEQRADLVLAMGTSLCGMNADRMVKTPSKKYLRHHTGLGSIIVGFQRTKMDRYASLRIFARIDEVMLLLAMEMNLPVRTLPHVPHIPKECQVAPGKHIFRVPYRTKTTGKKCSSSSSHHRWDLSKGAKVRLTGGPGKGFLGYVVSTPTDSGASRDCSYTVQFPCTREGSKEFGKQQRRYALGTWFVEAACKGTLPMLPMVNVVDES